MDELMKAMVDHIQKSIEMSMSLQKMPMTELTELELSFIATTESAAKLFIASAKKGDE